MNASDRDLSEAGIQDRAEKAARDRGMDPRRLVINNQTGWPDNTILYKGYVAFVEYKTLDGKLSARQKTTIEEIKAHGFHVYVPKGLDDALKTIHRIATLVDNLHEHTLE